MTIDIKRVMAGEDVRAICAQTGPDNWAADNEMKQYDEATLQKFLQNDMNWLVVAWQGEQIAGRVCFAARS